MKKQFLAAVLAVLSTILSLQAGNSEFDAMKPFGFATCSSRTDSTPSATNITGGGAYTLSEALMLQKSGARKVLVLTSTGTAMDAAISSAISNHDIIIFDGSKGDFLLNKSVIVSNQSSKTLLGINGARICSIWHATADDIAALDSAGVRDMSTSSNTGGTLSNGSYVSEQCEFNTRQIMINRYNNQSEPWRTSGIFNVKGCTNVIFRNLQLVGPGAMDLGAADLISLVACTHVWVDHCDFSDGQDGNMDITQQSDFVTVSWCTFGYTERSYMHQNTNLCGGSNSNKADDDKLNITWAYNNWKAGCNARMPMARFGRYHMLNNYYTCVGNGSPCINPRINSEFLIEGNYFDKGVWHIYGASSATQVIWRGNNYIFQATATHPVVDDGTSASSLIPYKYPTRMTTEQVPVEVGTYAGATLDFKN